MGRKKKNALSEEEYGEIQRDIGRFYRLLMKHLDEMEPVENPIREVDVYILKNGKLRKMGKREISVLNKNKALIIDGRKLYGEPLYLYNGKWVYIKREEAAESRMPYKKMRVV